MQAKYASELINEDGVNGVSYSLDGYQVTVSSPLNDQPGTNPEQLIGLAWVTCLNATLKAILKEQNINRKTRVRVIVSLMDEPHGGYYFTLFGYGSIEGFSIDETKNILEHAHKRCPISKLIQANPHVSLDAELY